MGGDFPIPDQTAVTCANIILTEVIVQFGCPYDLHSDHGRNYESHLFQELCRLLEIKKAITLVCNPRGSGQAERFNRTLMRMVRSYLQGEDTEWDQNLGCLAAAYRATPNILMLGREVRVLAEIIYFFSGTKLSGEVVATYGDCVSHLRDWMQRAHDVAREHLKQQANWHRECADARKPLALYATGDLVWYLLETGQMSVTPKLRAQYRELVLVL